MVKKVMIPLIVGSTATVGVVGTALIVTTTKSSTTNNASEANFNSSVILLRKWNSELNDQQAIATQSLNINDITNAIIEFLYVKQNQFIKKINELYSVIKPVKKDGENNNISHISFNIPTQYIKDNSELNALAKTFFGDNINWNNVISYCKNKDANIVDINIQQIQNIEIFYSISKSTTDENIANITPEKIIVVANDKEYSILFEAERSFGTYELFMGLNNVVENGTIINRDQNIMRPMTLIKNTSFVCGDFNTLNEEEESIIDMVNKIDPNFIYSNKQSIFSNPTYLKNSNYINEILATPIFEKSQIAVEISYKNVNEKSSFIIQLSDDNLLKYSHLSDIHNWENGQKGIIQINPAYTSTDKLFDMVIEYINKKAKETYLDYPHTENFIKKITDENGNNNIFTMELNPNNNFSNFELIKQFPKIFSWLGEAWLTNVNALKTLPNVNKIKNIIVQFNFQVIGDLKTSTNIDVKIIPSKVTVTFDESQNLQDIVWYFSTKLQEQKSYLISFESVSDNQKIQETFLDDLVTWEIPQKSAIAIDQDTTSIGDVTAHITNYIYLRQYDKFGYMPIETIPQLPSLTDKTNNKFTINLISRLISQNMAKSQFKRMWNLEWDAWRQKIRNSSKAQKWIPNLDNISNMSIDYRVEELEKNVSTGMMRYKIKPISISIQYGYGTNTTWYLSGDLQEKNSYSVLFKTMYKPIIQHILPGQMIII